MNLYESITFPEPPADRPYVFLNMVSTIDGKIITGERNESVTDLGSAVDKLMMKRIEQAADAVIVGAETLRTAGRWNPGTETRIVVTRSGNLPWDGPCLQRGRGIVISPESSAIPEGLIRVVTGETTDWFDALRQLKELGIQRLLLLGGSELNAQFFRAGLVDEIFLTFAPKIKLGRVTPTIADGEPLAREDIQQFELIGHTAVESELFLRYRRRSGI